jgi:hypothetical protein
MWAGGLTGLQMVEAGHESSQEQKQRAARERLEIAKKRKEEEEAKMWAKEKEKGKQIQEAKALAQRSKLVQEEEEAAMKRNRRSNRSPLAVVAQECLTSCFGGCRNVGGPTRDRGTAQGRGGQAA